jgi:membrane protein YqaA with SNARE-associated domain
MERFVNWIQALAAVIGGPGLFLIAFLDSSFLSFPEANDLLLVAAVIDEPSRLVYYASMTVAGSLAGCLVLYYVGWRGGDALLRRRFSEAQLDRGREIFRRYGLWAVLIPSLLPPPAPFKVFVLLAGVAGIRPIVFSGAILVGRGIRYFGEGLLAFYYGEAAIRLLAEEGRTVALVLVGLALAGLAVVIVRRWSRAAMAADAGHEL